MTAHKVNTILIIALVAMLGFISYIGITVYQQHETEPAVVPPGSLGPRMTVMYLLPYNHSTGTLNNSYATDLLYYSHNVLSVWPNALANDTVQVNLNLGVSTGMFPVLQLTDLNITSYTVYLEIANVNQKTQNTTGGVLYTVSFNPILPIYTSSGTLSSIPPLSQASVTIPENYSCGALTVIEHNANPLTTMPMLGGLKSLGSEVY